MKSVSSGVLAFVLALCVICLGLVIYFANIPKADDRFSEFYLLDEDGQPCDYPCVVTAGSPFYVTLGIVNHEDVPRSYTICVLYAGELQKKVNSGTVKQGEKWETQTAITLTGTGREKKVEFYLYLSGEEKPHIGHPLVLTLDVNNQ